MGCSVAQEASVTARCSECAFASAQHFSNPAIQLQAWRQHDQKGGTQPIEDLHDRSLQQVRKVA